jgi:Zn finger protein HypA/HybF involved in hydrogenase expression
MATSDVLTPTLFTEHPEHALHLEQGWWVASCATCGCAVASDKRQDQCEREARRTPCPVCHPKAAA